MGIFPSYFIPQVNSSTTHSSARYKLNNMFRQSIARPLASANRLIGNRSFSAIAPRMGEGDTGAPKSGGAAASDSFSRREAANEAVYIKQQEQEKLQALKKKLSDQRD